jgi:type IV pilus assembly protein PilB
MEGVSGLSRALVQAGRLSRTEAEQLVQEAHSSGSTFIHQLVRSKRMSSIETALFASEAFGFPLVDVEALSLTHISEEWIDKDTALQRKIFPYYKKANKLYVLVSDPTQSSTFHAITFKTGLSVEPLVVEEHKLENLLQTFYNATKNALDAISDDEITQLDVINDGESNITGGGNSQIPQEDDAPIVKFLYQILLNAIKQGASDIHFEPYEKFYRIRYRIDGQLKEISQPPTSIKDRLAARIKVLSRLDISEKRVPQDGRMKIQMDKGRMVDFRVSTLPTLFGEKIVMRILEQSAATLDIDALGMEPSQKEALLEAIHRPYGMVLVTGPTGSGKTVSLYTCLNILNDPDTNISTAEDPAEINLPGINQVNVNEKAGLTFAAALKSFLRQDPDIIMVGEIRDFETADIAIKAAQTGHIVFSTLHTNNAPSTITRFFNMGVSPFNLATSVLLIMAQRLARRLCSCKKPVEIPKESLLQAGFIEEDFTPDLKIYGPNGCETCHGSGYKGRTGLYEVMPISENIARIIMKSGHSFDIADQARAEGMIELRRSGILKVIKGITSLEEVMAVTNE